MTPRWLRANLLPIPIFMALGAGLLVAATQPEQGGQAGFLDRAMPDFAQPPLAANPSGLSKADILGEVVLVNVFASWCASCRAEHPMLMQLAGADAVPLYGINWKDGKGAGWLFLQRFGNPYRAAGEDRDGALGAALNVTGVPETYLLDAEGRIRYRHIGPITEDIWQRVLSPMVTELRAAS